MINSDTTNKLLELARQRFGKLSPADEKLFRSVATGEPAVYTTGDEEKDKPANADKWGEDRTLAADRIAWLCTDRQARDLVTNKGILVRGAKIEGRLDLANIDISFWLTFWRCALPQGMILQTASVRGLHLGGSQSGPISADGIKVAGDLFLRNGFKAEGDVRLLGADIGGDLSCINGQFSNANGNALFADGIKVAGNVFLRNGFRAEGEVRLLGADIGGDIDCEKAQFSNPTGDTLNAERIKVAGNILLREGFKADGRVCLGFANVGMGLACTSVNPDTKMTLDLRAAKVGTFWDDAASWPDCGDLFLDGFVYERLDDHAPRDAASRIKWLRLQPADQFLPQPYEQLAAVFKKEGLEEDAKKILIAKNEDPARLRQMHNIFRKAWHYVKMVTIRYGYRPWYALIHAAIVVLLGWGLFWCGNQFGLISPSTTFAYVQYADPPNSLPAGYPTFHSFVYSLDVFLPIIDLHQESHWLPHRDTFDRGPYLPVLVRWSWRVLECSLQWYMWAQIMIGWLLTSLFIAGFTRIIRS